jgi:iron complex outermembrane receptor protein
MRLLFSLYLGIFIFQNTVLAQQRYQITGRVTDQNGHSLPGATIMLHPNKKGIVSDIDGKFTIIDLKAGEYTLTVSFLGHNDYFQHLIVKESVELDIQLSQAVLSLQEVAVTCYHDEKRKKEEPLGLEVVSKNYLRQNLGGSLMKSLERLPGITTIDIGSGQSKPIIRGLGFNRVVVVENGIKHEGQQWGADHGLEIDQYAVDKIEIIKGPASLIYGSDAIGGVIRIVQNEIPLQNSMEGNLDLTAKTNNNYLGSSLSFSGRKNWLYGNLRITVVDYADYKVPTDSVEIYSYKAALYKSRLRNTAGNELNYHATIGMIKNNFQNSLFINQINNKGGFFANAHGLEPRNIDSEKYDKSDRDIHFPYQDVRHVKVLNKTLWLRENIKIEANMGFQRNFRQEWSQYVSHGYMPAVFPDSLIFPSDLEREFQKDYYSGNVKIDFSLNNSISLTTGANSDYQKNQIDGRGFIIPTFHQYTIGGFILTRYSISELSTLSIGCRYDNGKLNSESYFDWFLSPVIIGTDTSYHYLQRANDINRTFSSLSWSVGYNFNPANWTIKANIGKSFRMPIAKELEANGVNYHHFSYEVGDPDLSPEISYQADIGAEFNSKKLAAGISPFVNYFSNYIYLNPNYIHDRFYGNGNQTFNYTESSVIRYGGELHAHYKIIESVRVGVIGEYVYSKQLSGEKKGYSLPFSPPPSAILNAKYQRDKDGVFENTYLSIDYRITGYQGNIVPPEEETEGSQVINLSMGSTIQISKQSLNISMLVKNLLNNKYFNHTSYYRLINIPEPGRNLILNISIPLFKH